MKISSFFERVWTGCVFLLMLIFARRRRFVDILDMLLLCWFRHLQLENDHFHRIKAGTSSSKPPFSGGFTVHA